MGGKRKRDPVTGKCILNPSDTNRIKRPTRKIRTAAEKIARSEDAGEIEGQKRRNGNVSVSMQKVPHTDDVVCSVPRRVKSTQWRRATSM